MRDEDRRPVLAHQRFEARRKAFAGLDLAQRFQKIHETNLWGADGSISGLGSEAAATQVLGERLPGLLREIGACSLLDAPCGDALWISRIELGIPYIGLDIVPALVQALRAREDGRDYRLGDITQGPLPDADAILCRDCLVHLSFANIAKAMANFRASGARWLIATTFPEISHNADCEDGDWRPLNLERAPFRWPKPFALVEEDCAEANGDWRDKSLGVWRLADLP